MVNYKTMSEKEYNELYKEVGGGVASKSNMVKPITARNAIIAKRVLCGETYASIADDYGISGNHVMNVFKQVIVRVTRGEYMTRDINVNEFRRNRVIWMTRINRHPKIQNSKVKGV